MEFLDLALTLIILGVLLEALFLGFWLRRTKKSMFWPVEFFLGSGILLLLSVKMSIAGASPALIGGLLLMAGAFHVACLRLAFRSC